MSVRRPTRTRKIQKRRRQPGEVATRRTAIRNFCLECLGYNSAEVRRCTSPKCWLWPYRCGNTGPLSLDPAVEQDPTQQSGPGVAGDA